MAPLLHFVRLLIALPALYAFFCMGRALSALLHLPIPGVVLGLALLTAAIAALRRTSPHRELQFVATLNPAARPLLKYLGLLFVPAGAGVIEQWPLLRAEWLPVLAGLFGSTLLGLAITALITQRLWPGEGK